MLFSLHRAYPKIRKRTFIKESNNLKFKNKMKIEAFTIKNYRSIKELKIENLNPVNVFFGKTLTPHHFREYIKPQLFIEFSHFLRDL